MVANGGDAIGHFIRRPNSTNSPRRHPGSAHPRDFDSLMELPKLLQRGASFKTHSPMRYQSPHYGNNAQHGARSPCRKNLWLTLALCVACFLSLSFFLFLQRNTHLSRRSGNGYGVVIDIGDADSRITIFQYADAAIPAVTLLRSYSKPTETFSGLSGDAYHASAPLFDLLEFAKAAIPEKERPQTRVYALGTGGLGWLSAQSQAELLLQCRTVLRVSGFWFRDEWAMVINGRDEGVYEWVAANYAHGTLHNDPLDTIGVLRLDDASVQVTFIPEEMPPPAFLHKSELWGVTHNLYSNSFEKFGLDSASRSLLEIMHSRAVKPSKDGTEDGVVTDPCTPRGYVTSSDGNELPGNTFATVTELPVYSIQPAGNFTECRAAALTLLQQGQDLCPYKNCAVGTTFVPELRGNFYATKNFYSTSKFFGLPAKASLAELVAAGESYCGQEWGDLKDSHPGVKHEELRKYCFSAAYIVAFLHDSLGFPVYDDRLRFTNKVDNVPLQWTLGAFLVHLAKDGDITPPSAAMFEEIFIKVLSFLGLVVLGGILLWFVARWRRPQLKTIYDLEKGRYITTATRGR